MRLNGLEIRFLMTSGRFFKRSVCKINYLAKIADVSYIEFLIKGLKKIIKNCIFHNQILYEAGRNLPIMLNIKWNYGKISR